MEKPDLTQMWETFIKIPTADNMLSFIELYDIVRTWVKTVVTSLVENNIINWYCFLIHDKNSGVPTTQDDNSPYFHIRFALRNGADTEVFLKTLPKHCVLTRKIEGGLESISGIDKTLIKHEDVREAWRIIGEQSEWFIHLIDIHKENVGIPPQQIGQFLHYFANMTQLKVK